MGPIGGWWLQDISRRQKPLAGGVPLRKLTKTTFRRSASPFALSAYG